MKSNKTHWRNSPLLECCHPRAGAAIGAEMKGQTIATYVNDIINVINVINVNNVNNVRCQ